MSKKQTPIKTQSTPVSRGSVKSADSESSEKKATVPVEDTADLDDENDDEPQGKENQPKVEKLHGADDKDPNHQIEGRPGVIGINAGADIGEYRVNDENIRGNNASRVVTEPADTTEDHSNDGAIDTNPTEPTEQEQAYLDKIKAKRERLLKFDGRATARAQRKERARKLLEEDAKRKEQESNSGTDQGGEGQEGEEA